MLPSTLGTPVDDSEGGVPQPLSAVPGIHSPGSHTSSERGPQVTCAKMIRVPGAPTPSPADSLPLLLRSGPSHLI